MILNFSTPVLRKDPKIFNTNSLIYYIIFHLLLWPCRRVFDTIINVVCNRVPCIFGDLEDGSKYLSFHLKPNKYQKEDWAWLVEKHIQFWCNRLLSQAGTLVLVKSVMEATLIFIVERIRILGVMMSLKLYVMRLSLFMHLWLFGFIYFGHSLIWA